MSKRTKKHLFSNFGGGVKSDVANIYLGEGFVADSYNVDYSRVPGAASKRKGYTRVNSSALDSGKNITGIYQTLLNGSWVQLVCAGTKVYSWDGVTTFTDKTPGGVTFADSKNYYWDFCTTRTTTNGFVIFLTNGQDQIQKYDGTTMSAISITEGYNYFKCNYLANFKNYCIFANTWEGANLANTWTNTSGTIYTYDNTDGAFDPGIEIGDVFNSTTEMTATTGTTPSSGQYSVSSGVLYVNIGGAPGTNIHITFKCKERVRWSGLGNAEGYTAANYIDVVSSSAGSAIVRIMPMRDLLVIYKEDSIWAMYYTGDSNAPFGLYCIDHNTPCYSGWSVADVKGDHLFLSKEGIMKTDGSKIDPVLVSKQVPEWFKYSTLSGWKYAYAATNEYKKQYRLLIPLNASSTSTNNNREIRYDYENDVWSIHGYAVNGNVIATIQANTSLRWDDVSLAWDEISSTWNDFSTFTYPKFYSGDYSGYIREHDEVDYDQEGTNTSINAWFKTKTTYLSDEKEDITKRKNLLKARLMLDRVESATVTLRTSTDGGLTYSQSNGVSTAQVSSTIDGAYVIPDVDLDKNGYHVTHMVYSNNAYPFTVYWIETEYILRSEL